MIKAEQVGRNLELTPWEGADPYVIRPLPGLAGVQITTTYLDGISGKATSEDVVAAMQIAVDGARESAITGRWEPLPEDERVIYRRIERELSLAEAEMVLVPAFFWQTVLGMTGVNSYLLAGGGAAGTVKVLRALAVRSGVLPPRTSPKDSVTD